jgi:hypothetical protein
VFATDIYVHPSLIFVGKVRNVSLNPVESRKGLHIGKMFYNIGNLDAVSVEHVEISVSSFL